MVKKAGEILALLFVGLALGFLVTAMTTHGWLIIHHVRYRDHYWRGPSWVSINNEIYR